MAWNLRTLPARRGSLKIVALITAASQMSPGIFEETDSFGLGWGLGSGKKGQLGRDRPTPDAPAMLMTMMSLVAHKAALIGPVLYTYAYAPFSAGLTSLPAITAGCEES